MINLLSLTKVNVRLYPKKWYSSAMQMEVSHRKLERWELPISRANLWQLVECMPANPLEQLCNGYSWRMLHSSPERLLNNNHLSRCNSNLIILLTTMNQLGLLAKELNLPLNPHSKLRLSLLDRKWLYLLIKLKSSRKMGLLLLQKRGASSP